MSSTEATQHVKARVKTPTILQMEAVECGAASLAIVLAHFGRWVPLEDLREACGVTRDGSNARAVMRAARSYGLEVHAYRDSLKSIKKRSLPIIVFWEMNHFLVVEGWRDGEWFLNDPASGPRTVNDDEFSRGFAGIAITCAPSPDFVRGGEKPRAIPSLLAHIGKTRLAIAFLVIAGIALIVPGLAVPALSKAFVDSYLVSDHDTYGRAILAGLAICVVLQALLTWMQQTITSRMRTVLTSRLFAAHTQRILRLTMRFFAQRSAGDISYRSMMGASIAGLLSGPMTQTLLTSAVAVVYLAVIFFINVWIGLVIAVAAAVIMLLLRRIARKQADLGQRQQRDQMEAVVTQAGTLSLIESIKASGNEIESLNKVSASRTKLLTTRQSQDVMLVPILATPATVSGIATIVVLAVGALQVMNGTLTFGSLLAIQILMGSVLAPLGGLVSLTSQIQQLQAVLSRLGDIDTAAIDPEIAGQLERETNPSSGAHPIALLRGALELRGVSFGYASMEPPLIENFDLALDPGSRVALVGGSGSGKSTVGRVIVGLQQPWSGDVLIDGIDRRELDRRVIADGLAFVDQQITIFEGTVRDNITMWDNTIPESLVFRAAMDAQLHEVITARPGGYDSVLSAGGRELSGGQRQRLEIARALVRDPRIVILDEATSALDTVTEADVMLALKRRGCTCVLVAHRLSTVRDADEIIVLDEGKASSVALMKHSSPTKAPTGSW